MLLYTCIFTDEKFRRLSHTGRLAWLHLARILDPNWGHAEASLGSAVAQTWPIEQAAAENGDKAAEAIIEEAKTQLRLAIELGLLIIDYAEGCPVIAYNQWERYHKRLTRRAAPRERMSKAIARTRDFGMIGPKSEAALKDWAERFRLVAEVKRTKDLWAKQVPNQFHTSSELVPNQCGASAEPVLDQFGTSSAPRKREKEVGKGNREEGPVSAVPAFPNVIRLADKNCPEEIREALQQVAGLAAVQATRNMGVWTAEVVIPATGGDLPLDIASEVFVAAHCLDLIAEDRSKRKSYYHTRRNNGEVPPAEAVAKARAALGLPPKPGASPAKAEPEPEDPLVEINRKGEWLFECILCGEVLRSKPVPPDWLNAPTCPNCGILDSVRRYHRPEKGGPDDQKRIAQIERVYGLVPRVPGVGAVGVGLDAPEPEGG
jgi:hypothetical protein